MRDVCPFTRVRCKTPEACRTANCVYLRDAVPISENSLSQADRYALAMAEKEPPK